MFKKDKDGNWYNEDNGFYLGTQDGHGENFYQHLYDSGNMGLREIIDDIMGKVNLSLESA